MHVTPRVRLFCGLILGVVTLLWLVVVNRERLRYEIRHQVALQQLEAATIGSDGLAVPGVVLAGPVEVTLHGYGTPDANLDNESIVSVGSTRGMDNIDRESDDNGDDSGDDGVDANGARDDEGASDCAGAAAGADASPAASRGHVSRTVRGADGPGAPPPEGMALVDDGVRRGLAQSSHAAYEYAPLGQVSDEELRRVEAMRVYVYEEGMSSFNEELADHVRDSLYRKHKYDTYYWYFEAERNLLERLREDPHRTLDPDDAEVFYVPFLAGLHALCYESAQTTFEEMRRLLVDSLPYWGRNNGRDHVFFFTPEYGACMSEVRAHAGRTPETTVPEWVQDAIFMSHLGDRNMAGCFRVDRDIIVPPNLREDVVEMALAANGEDGFSAILNDDRPQLVAFRGKKLSVRDVRRRVAHVLLNDERFNYTSAHLSPAHLKDHQVEMEQSQFCICPAGVAPWSPRLVQAVLAGCIPVLVSDDMLPPFDELYDWSTFSLHVSESHISELYDILTQVGPERQQSMRQALAQLAPKMLLPRRRLAGKWGERDALDDILLLLSRRINV